jgi:hypothetical protein
MTKTFTERIQNVAPKLGYQGLFHSFEIERTDSGPYSPGLHLRVTLKPDQVSDTEGMELRFVKRYFCGDFTDYGYGIKRMKEQQKQQILEIMGTSIVKDFSLAHYYIPDQIYVIFSTAGSSRIFIDPNFGFEVYSKIIEKEGVRILEANGKEKSNVRHCNLESIHYAFPTKLKSGEIVFQECGEFGFRKLVEPKNVDYPKETNKPTNVRTFEILGDTEKPWNEPHVRSAFAKILLKDLMNPDFRPFRIAFSNDPDCSFSKLEACFSDIKDVIEKRVLLDAFRIRKKVSVGKKDAMVVYGKGKPIQDNYIANKQEYYYLDVYAKTRKDIEAALLQLK